VGASVKGNEGIVHPFLGPLCMLPARALVTLVVSLIGYAWRDKHYFLILFP